MHTDFLSGVGGIRTLVQTRNNIAFYTLSFCLIFDDKKDQKPPTYRLFLIKFRNDIKILSFLGLLLRNLKINRRKPRLLGDFLLAHLVSRGTILL